MFLIIEMENLHTRHSHNKATLMYKIIKDQSAPLLRASFTKLNDGNTNYNVSNLETSTSKAKNEFPQTQF